MASHRHQPPTEGVPEIPTAEQRILLDELFGRGILIKTDVQGVYGHGPIFEKIRLALAAIVDTEAGRRGAESLQFPPLFARRDLEVNGYVARFPHLAGIVFSFHGDEPEAEAQAGKAEQHEEWDEHQRMTEIALVPAACYPVYPAIASRGELPAGGYFINAGAPWVFRREPSFDPARRQIFHQHELVRIGDPAEVLEWREDWVSFGHDLLARLGLAAQLVKANDPFFGKVGRVLAQSQLRQELKLELQLPWLDSVPIAVASFNYHLDYFARVYGIKRADGDFAQSACLGFGHERIVLALLVEHGFDLERWPEDVAAELWS